MIQVAADLHGVPGARSPRQIELEIAVGHPPDSQLWGRRDTGDTGGYHLRPFGRPMIEGYYGADLARGLEAEGQEGFYAFAVEADPSRTLESVEIGLTSVDGNVGVLGANVVAAP